MRPSNGDVSFLAVVGAAVALVGLGASATALGLAPVLMPDDYSWVEHTTSDSAAQTVSGAWLGRLGLLLFGLAVLAGTADLMRSWGQVAALLHICFATLLTASAVFSTRPWRPDAPFDQTEDVLHSVAATGMGFAFAFGVVAVLVFARDSGPLRRAVGTLAVTASVALPLAMVMWPDVQGVLQRTMFAIAYLWYGYEIVRHLRTRGQPAAPFAR